MSNPFLGLEIMKMQALKEYAKSLMQSGEAHRIEKRYAEAIHDFTASLEIYPDHPWLLAHRGNAYAKMEHFDRALNDLHHAITRKPDYYWALSHLVNVYVVQRRFDSALRILDENENLFEENMPSYVGEKSLIYNYKGEFEKTIELCRPVVEQDPEDFVALYSLAVARFMRNGSEDVQELLDELENLLNRKNSDDPDDLYGAIVMYRLAGVQMMRGDPGRALELLERAMEYHEEARGLSINDPVWKIGDPG